MQIVQNTLHTVIQVRESTVVIVKTRDADQYTVKKVIGNILS
jgi:hypothetical protein